MLRLEVWFDHDSTGIWDDVWWTTEGSQRCGPCIPWRQSGSGDVDCMNCIEPSDTVEDVC